MNKLKVQSQLCVASTFQLMISHCLSGELNHSRPIVK